MKNMQNVVKKIFLILIALLTAYKFLLAKDVVPKPALSRPIAFEYIFPTKTSVLTVGDSVLVKWNTQIAEGDWIYLSDGKDSFYQAIGKINGTSISWKVGDYLIETDRGLKTEGPVKPGQYQLQILSNKSDFFEIKSSTASEFLFPGQNEKLKIGTAVIIKWNGDIPNGEWVYLSDGKGTFYQGIGKSNGTSIPWKVGDYLIENDHGIAPSGPAQPGRYQFQIRDKKSNYFEIQ